jgi:hypothetical protein
MPITQDRMLAVIAAAEDWQQATEHFVELIRRINGLRESGQRYQEDLAYLLGIRNAIELLTNASTTLNVLAQEKAHFKTVRARNIRHSRYMQRRRASQGFEQMTPEQIEQFARLTGKTPEHVLLEMPQAPIKTTGGGRAKNPPTPAIPESEEEIFRAPDGQGQAPIEQEVPTVPSPRLPPKANTSLGYNMYEDGDIEDEIEQARSAGKKINLFDETEMARINSDDKGPDGVQ